MLINSTIQQFQNPVKKSMPKKVIWTSMANWRLYSFKPDQINRQVGSPWIDFFSETYSNIAEQLRNQNSRSGWLVKRVLVPAFYYFENFQQSSIQIQSTHKIRNGSIS